MIKKLGLTCRYKVKHYRGGKLLEILEFHNDIVDEGANDLLNVAFGGAAQNPWLAFGLIDNAGFTTLANSDTAALHPGWVENIDYTEGNRVVWADDIAAGRIKTNAMTSADFSINTAGTINGIFGSNDSVKGSTGGILWATASFPNGALPVANLDILKVQYTLTVG